MKSGNFGPAPCVVWVAFVALAACAAAFFTPSADSTLPGTTELAAIGWSRVIIALTFAVAGSMVERARARREERSRSAAQEAHHAAVLRELARELGEMTAVHEIVQRTAHRAVEATQALGAYVERTDPLDPRGEVEVIATAGRGVPQPGLRVPYPDSLTGEIIESGRPGIIMEIGSVGVSMAPYLRETCRECSGVVVPLAAGGDPLGTLVVLRSADQDPFTREEADFIRSLGDVTSVALGRARLFEIVAWEHEKAEIERNRLQTLLDSLPVGVVLVDAQGRITAMNPAVQALWGKGPMPETLDQMNRFKGWWPGTGKEVAPQEWELPRALWRGETSTAEEIDIETFDGERKTILAYGLPIRDPEGAIVGAVAINVDITDRRVMEERERFLAESGRVFAASLEVEATLKATTRLAVPRLADGCAVFLFEGDELRLVETAHSDPAEAARVRELHRRYGPDALTPSRMSQVVLRAEPMLVSAITEPMLKEVAQDEEHFRMLVGLNLRSAMVVPLLARERPFGAIVFVSTKSGRRYRREDLDFAMEFASRAAYAVDTARLFEEARQARGEAERRAREEAALRRAASVVGAAFTIDKMVWEIAHSALAATNADGAVVERIVLERNEVEVVAVAGQRRVPLGSRMSYPGSLAQWVVEREKAELLSRLEENRESVTPELLQACPDCSALAVPLRDIEQAIGVLILLREPEKRTFRPDEIERANVFANLASLAFHKVHLLEESERRREELAEVLRSRSRLMRGFSHDVKNPLGTADGQLQLLEEGIPSPLDAAQKEGVARARRAIGNAIRLIDDLLELARTSAGEVKIERGPVELRLAVREIAEEYRPRAAAKGLTMDIIVPEELPIIESDAGRIRQVLGNLLSNAVKYTSEGGITVRVEERSGGSAPGPGRWIATDVTDTGAGLTRDQQARLFREFSRVETAGAEPGAGVGLAISRSIARALGGDVTVEGEPGRGSTFTLWLPDG